MAIPANNRRAKEEPSSKSICINHDGLSAPVKRTDTVRAVHRGSNGILVWPPFGQATSYQVQWPPVIAVQGRQPLAACGRTATGATRRRVAPSSVDVISLHVAPFPPRCLGNDSCFASLPFQKGKTSSLGNYNSGFLLFPTFASLSARRCKFTLASPISLPSRPALASVRAGVIILLLPVVVSTLLPKLPPLIRQTLIRAAAN